MSKMAIPGIDRQPSLRATLPSERSMICGIDEHHGLAGDAGEVHDEEPHGQAYLHGRHAGPADLTGGVEHVDAERLDLVGTPAERSTGVEAGRAAGG
jgi:hypothetical protein